MEPTAIRAAFAYLDSVKRTYANDPQVYDRFLALMGLFKDRQCVPSSLLPPPSSLLPPPSSLLPPPSSLLPPPSSLLPPPFLFPRWIWRGLLTLLFKERKQLLIGFERFLPSGWGMRGPASEGNKARL
ncbi:hypothetical protein DACRYDRAFT_106662 [Dacryopinax primogenitus]|uniref:Uncharacterized protein n=1 Tax=Dacryopinax primogenitus (strain DJM 731) TaxID=1858805 RepID=M5G9Q0_DACPD|nr:uncharacterized protein DACRYDRAFT_106662 [Dacryopinax primogenitus]EJU02597.1 hypothetical protein DACRYDRAFT_106662 [Dacryopinax primogenitus]